MGDHLVFTVRIFGDNLQQFPLYTGNCYSHDSKVEILLYYSRQLALPVTLEVCDIDIPQY